MFSVVKSIIKQMLTQIIFNEFWRKQLECVFMEAIVLVQNYDPNSISVKMLVIYDDFCIWHLEKLGLLWDIYLIFMSN